MSSNHSKVSVEKAIANVKGVKSVETSLTREIAHLPGELALEAIIVCGITEKPLSCIPKGGVGACSTKG